jgi:hypothetical protein
MASPQEPHEYRWSLRIEGGRIVGVRKRASLRIGPPAAQESDDADDTGSPSPPAAA